jgi:NAD(P)-dependent dehydrogenase (short-subunit alcohol dehydrogenase family)
VIVLITGAASGIGRACAEGFVRDGDTVVGVDVDGDRLAEVGGIDRVVADVADVAAVEAFVAGAVERHGRLDVLCNNAGYALRRRVEDLQPGEWERLFAVHVLSALHAMRVAIPVMRAQGFGRIVNTISRGGEVALAGNSAYAVAKAALWTLTRSVATEVADADILVNALIPGPTNTAIWGADRPDLQSPDAVYPHLRFVATLPAGGPSGRVFWNSQEYPFMSRAWEGRVAPGPGS